MNFDRVLDVIVILFGAGGIGSLWMSAKRIKAQNDLDISTAWEKLSAPLLKRVSDLEKTTETQEATINDLHDLVADLRGWAERLAKQVVDLGGIPAPFISRKSHPLPPHTTTEYPKTQE